LTWHQIQFRYKTAIFKQKKSTKASTMHQNKKKMDFLAIISSKNTNFAPNE
jgi:hypothetical protein